MYTSKWNTLSGKQKSIWKNKEDYDETIKGASRILIDEVEIGIYPKQVCRRCGASWDETITITSPLGTLEDACKNCGCYSYFYTHGNKKLEYLGWTGGKNGGHRFKSIKTICN